MMGDGHDSLYCHESDHILELEAPFISLDEVDPMKPTLDKKILAQPGTPYFVICVT